uniref:Small integral membrane protein 14 n=1 Tax=Lygus hesperus TaxID=30085 RepID=A0A0A9X760_LYGHE
MSDEGMDLCGVIWNHEMTMRRLLSLLRQSQTTCSDTECYGPIQTNSGNDGFMMMTLCWMAVAFLLYIMRPASIRNRENDMKPARGNGDNGDGGNPPASPAI